MFLHRRIEIRWIDLGTGLGHGLDLADQLVECLNAKTDRPAPVVAFLSMANNFDPLSANKIDPPGA